MILSTISNSSIINTKRRHQVCPLKPHPSPPLSEEHNKEWKRRDRRNVLTWASVVPHGVLENREMASSHA